MEIIALLGSPHGLAGNTAALTAEVAAGARAAGATVEILCLTDYRVGPCLACDACHRQGRCSLPDDFAPLFERLRSCDGFILASPNYIFSVSAQLKAFFDRCCGPIHCQALTGKYGVAVETSGGGGDDEVLRYMERFIRSLGALAAGSIGSNMAGPQTFPEQPHLFAQARELGRELVRCIGERQSFPEQETECRAFAGRMRDLANRMQDHWPYEYRFWQQVSQR